MVLRKLPSVRPAWFAIVTVFALLDGCAQHPPPAPQPVPVSVAVPVVVARAVVPVAPPRWVAITIGGEPVGRTHETHAARAGGVSTRSVSELRIGRLGRVVEMAFDATFDEDAGGALQAVHTEIRLSRQTTTAEVSLAAGVATVRDAAGGQVHTRTVALPGPVLGPEAIRRGLAGLHASGDAFDYVTWSPQLSAPQHVHCQAEARETVEIDGAARALLRVKVTAEGEASPRLAWLDAGGHELRTEVAMPLGKMVASEVHAEPAIASGNLTTDAFTKSLVRSNVRLPAPRALDQLVVELTFDDPAAQLPPLDSADEHVIARAPGHASIEIDRVHVPASAAAGAAGAATGAAAGAAAGAATGAAPGPEFLAASTTIDSGDPQVAALAREAIGEATDPWDQAQRLTRWVTAHMTFDAGIAFASAAELARDRHGTCAGYAVLLASLLRAANIPARLDLGLVYIDGIFGGHAWVEAFLRGQWVPLDAAVPSAGPADAARIPLARDAVDRGPGAAISSFGQVIGRAKIRVVGYTSGGRTSGAGGAGGGVRSGGASASGGGGAGSPAVRTDDATAPYAIDGARYTNRGLGLTVTRPADAQFASADAVWPDRTLVAVERAGARVAILEAAVPPGDDPALAAARAVGLDQLAACAPRTVAGHRACAATKDGVAKLALDGRGALFVLEARGPGAPALLDAVIRTLRLDDAAR